MIKGHFRSRRFKKERLLITYSRFVRSETSLAFASLVALLAFFKKCPPPVPHPRVGDRWGTGGGHCTGRWTSSPVPVLERACRASPVSFRIFKYRELGSSYGYEKGYEKGYNDCDYKKTKGLL